MKLYLASLIFLASAVHSESWIEISRDYECPDLLVLADEKYEIFNDCYGFDPRNPIVDSGNFEQKEGYFIFSKRKIEQPSFLGKEAFKRFEVISKTNTELSIQVGSTIHRFKVYPAVK